MAAPHLTSAADLLASDRELASLSPNVVSTFSQPASDDAVDRAVRALQANKHHVTVVDSKEQALAAVLKLIPDDVSVADGGSTTLREIGWVAAFKAAKTWRNLKAIALAEKDPVKQADLRRQALSADVFVSSVCAITEDGSLFVVDASGTRVGGFLAAKRVIVVVGANKIVPNDEAARQRTLEWCFPLESARSRLEYGLPGSKVVFDLKVGAPHPVFAKSFDVIIVRGVSLGY